MLTRYCKYQLLMCRTLATITKVNKQKISVDTHKDSSLIDFKDVSSNIPNIPTDTLYVIDGTAMLFQAYFSQEHSYGYKNDIFSKELNGKLLSTLPHELIGQIQALNNKHANNFVIDTTIGIDDVLSTNDTHFGNIVDIKLNTVLSTTNIVDNSQQLRLKCGAVTLMATHLARFIRDVKPKYLAVAFDAAKKTFRNDLFPKYKQQRLSIPPDMPPLFGVLPDMCEAMGIKCFMRTGYEADDVMASLGTWARQRDLHVVHVSMDKDMLQLVDEGVSIMLPNKTRDVVGIEQVIAKYGISPSQFTDYQALIGDTVDNIPGVRGIGPKAAVGLLTHFSHLEDMYSRLHLIGVPPLSDEMKARKPTDAVLISHLKAALTSEQFKAAISELDIALKTVKASSISTLAKLYQCSYAELMVFKQLVSLRCDLTVEDTLYARHLERNALLNSVTEPDSLTAVFVDDISTNNAPLSSSNTTLNQQLNATNGSEVLTVDYLRYVGEDPVRRGVQVEEYLRTISHSLSKPLKLLREQFKVK